MHKPVMLQEVLDGLQVRPGGRYIDATVGNGGHSAAILERSAPDGRLMGLDRDREALAEARRNLAADEARCLWVHDNFEQVDGQARRNDFTDVDGILFDLGVRSDQLDQPERGFSFMKDGPLDMRMDQTESSTAADLVNTLPEQDLAALFYQLGEERSSRRIAHVLVERRTQRTFETTGDLAATVEKAVGGRHGRIHPATRVFMALRMAVNRELESIRAGVGAALSLVRPGGRVAVITFHSVEDRLVKRLLAEHIGVWESQEAGGRLWRGELPKFEKVTRKPLMACDDELNDNPRARSAKLRVVERMAA